MWVIPRENKFSRFIISRRSLNFLSLGILVKLSQVPCSNLDFTPRDPDLCRVRSQAQGWASSRLCSPHPAAEELAGKSSVVPRRGLHHPPAGGTEVTDKGAWVPSVSLGLGTKFPRSERGSRRPRVISHHTVLASVQVFCFLLNPAHRPLHCFHGC